MVVGTLVCGDIEMVVGYDDTLVPAILAVVVDNVVCNEMLDVLAVLLVGAEIDEVG